jgi:hypothetical protein
MKLSGIVNRAIFIGNKLSKAATLVLLLGLLLGAATSLEFDLTFQGYEISQETVSVSEETDVSFSIANRAESPYTDIKIVAEFYEVSSGEKRYQYTLRNDFNLAGREIETINSSIPLEDSMPEGSYEVHINAKTPSGTTVAYITEGLDIVNPNRFKSAEFGRRGVYLILPRVVSSSDSTTRYERISIGSQGKNAIPGKPFDIAFNVENLNEEKIDPTAKVTIRDTYSSEDPIVKEYTKDLDGISANGKKYYELNGSVSEPGTYEVLVEVEDEGLKLASGEVRLVIAGPSGSITNMENRQDVYNQGETVTINSTIVGSADGSTQVPMANLNLTVVQNNETKYRDSKRLEKLPFNPVEKSFEFSSPTDLDNYTVRLVLGSSGLTFDTYEARYQEIKAEKYLSDQGWVVDENVCIDDNICTEREKEIGNCYDCRGLDTENKTGEETDEKQTIEYRKYIPALIIISTVLIIFIIYKFVNRENRGEENQK